MVKFYYIISKSKDLIEHYKTNQKENDRGEKQCISLTSKNTILFIDVVNFKILKEVDFAHLNLSKFPLFYLNILKVL